MELYKTNLTLPREAVQAFMGLTPAERDEYAVALRRLGWTLKAIADGMGVSRERVRQITAKVSAEEDVRSQGLPLPTPPVKPVKPGRPVVTEPSADTLNRLLELKERAASARGRSSRYYAEGQEFNKLIEHAVKFEKVSVYTLAKRLGYTYGAVRSRLHTMHK